MTKEQDTLACTLYGKLHPPITQESLMEAYSLGMIPKCDLIVGTTYLGHCRNASEAIWTGECFNYERTKFGDKFREDIVCPEDDVGYDIFVAVGIKE
jgi:hypothetical protein